MEAVHRAALALGTANQLTNILRDVGEDAMQRNRIYVPRDELAAFGITEAEVGARGSVPLLAAAGNSVYGNMIPWQRLHELTSGSSYLIMAWQGVVQWLCMYCQ